jgi:hypothetical protein
MDRRYPAIAQAAINLGETTQILDSGVRQQGRVWTAMGSRLTFCRETYWYA